MDFFQNMACDGKSVTYYFFPALFRAGLEYFLRKSRIDSWEILSKAEAKTKLPDDLQYPEARLSPTAPRLEKHICCFVSHYNEEDFDREYQRLIFSQDWLDWHNQRAKNEPECDESQEKESTVPLSLLSRRESEKKAFFFCMTICHQIVARCPRL